MSPELRHLRSFIAVAEELSFTGAADRLFISQQALSRGIRQLERELGVDLFERTTRSTRLTPAGEALLPEAVRAAAAADHAFDTARRVGDGGRAAALRVDVSSSSMRTAALVVEHFREHNPGVAVQETEVGETRGWEMLRTGRLDALLGFAAPAPADVASFPLRHEPVLLGMAEGHPMSSRDQIPVSDLEGVELLLPADDAAPGWNTFVEAFCSQAGYRPRRAPGHTHGMVAAARRLREGSCVVPTASWVEPLDGLVFRHIVDPTPLFPWSVMTKSGDDRPEIDAWREAAREVRAAEGWDQP